MSRGPSMSSGGGSASSAGRMSSSSAARRGAMPSRVKAGSALGAAGAVGFIGTENDGVMDMLKNWAVPLGTLGLCGVGAVYLAKRMSDLEGRVNAGRRQDVRQLSDTDVRMIVQQMARDGLINIPQYHAPREQHAQQQTQQHHVAPNPGAYAHANQHDSPAAAAALYGGAQRTAQHVPRQLSANQQQQQQHHQHYQPQSPQHPVASPQAPVSRVTVPLAATPWKPKGASTESVADDAINQSAHSAPHMSTGSEVSDDTNQDAPVSIDEQAE